LHPILPYTAAGGSAGRVDRDPVIFKITRAVPCRIVGTHKYDHGHQPRECHDEECGKRRMARDAGRRSTERVISLGLTDKHEKGGQPVINRTFSYPSLF